MCMCERLGPPLGSARARSSQEAFARRGRCRQPRNMISTIIMVCIIMYYYYYHYYY